MYQFARYLFEWSDFLYLSAFFFVAIRRQWHILDTTVESAKAALLLPKDDPSRKEMAYRIDRQQRWAFGTIRFSLFAILVIFYYTAPL